MIGEVPIEKKMTKRRKKGRKLRGPGEMLWQKCDRKADLPIDGYTYLNECSTPQHDYNLKSQHTPEEPTQVLFFEKKKRLEEEEERLRMALFCCLGGCSLSDPAGWENRCSQLPDRATSSHYGRFQDPCTVLHRQQPMLK